MPRLPLVPARRRPRRQLFAPMAAGVAARRIQAAARGFLARRQVAGMRRPRLMSPMDIGKIKRVKRPQGQVKRPSVMPKYRIGSLIGTEVSKRKSTMKGLDPMVIRKHVDTNHEILQEQVAYFGFPDAGGLDQQLEMACLALAQMIYRRSGIKVTHAEQDYTDTYTMDLALNRLARVRIGFQRTNANGVMQFAETSIQDADLRKMSDLATAIQLNCNQQADVGFWPYIMVLFEAEGDQYKSYASYDLANVMVDFTAMQKYKWQNVTSSTGVIGTSSINDVSANPLSGRIYQFKGPVPKLRPAVKDGELEFPADNLGQIEEIDEKFLYTRAFRTAADYAQALKRGFKQPFKANGVFKNTLHEDKVYMPPGGYKQLIRNTKATMNFKRFVQATYKNTGENVPMMNETRQPRIGTCTLWGLEPAVRTSATESLKLVCNNELWLSAKCRVSDTKQPVRAQTIVLDGHNFSA